MKAALEIGDKPRAWGSRAGIKPCAMIGQKLSALFEVPIDSSAEIDLLLKQIDRKISG